MRGQRWLTRSPFRLALLTMAIVAVAPVAWYLGSPLFINQVVDEEFPVANQVVAVPAGTASVPTVPLTQASPSTVPSATSAPATATTAPPTPTIALPTATVVSAAPPTITTAPAATATRPSSPPPPAVVVATTTPVAAVAPASSAPIPPSAPAPPTVTPPPPPTVAPSGPVAVLRGSFTRIDAVHWAEGSATIYRQPDGQQILRLENFRAGNGPGLFVYLAGHPQPRSVNEFNGGGALELAPLKGNIGNQNYVVLADLDLATFKSVVIYCKPFTTVFSTAALSPA